MFSSIKNKEDIYKYLITKLIYMLRKIFLIILLMIIVKADYQNFVCDNLRLKCPIDFSCGDGKTPLVWCDPDDCDECMVLCAKECGKMTNCTSDATRRDDRIEECAECCSDITCSIYPEGSYAQYACSEACEGKCEFRSEFCQIIRLLQFLSIGLGVILLSINARRWMMSDNESARDSAKRGIMYVILGMIIIFISLALVNFLYFGEIIC